MAMKVLAHVMVLKLAWKWMMAMYNMMLGISYHNG